MILSPPLEKVKSDFSHSLVSRHSTEKTDRQLFTSDLLIKISEDPVKTHL